MKIIPVALLFIFLSVAGVYAGNPDTTGRKWYVPDHVKLQFAGNIGFLAVGPGYNYLKEKMELDIMYGYVPEPVGGTLHSLTLKNTWIPVNSVQAGSRVKIELITASIPLTYTFGKQFFFVAPRDQYPARYYDYSSAFRIGISAGSRVNYVFEKNNCFREAGLYYEIGTYDLLLHNYIFNSATMRFGDIFNLALGIKLRLK